MSNHSAAYDQLTSQYPNGAWPIDSVDHLRTSWKSWCGNLRRFALRSDEYKSIEARFRQRAFELGVTLYNNGKSKMHEEQCNGQTDSAG